ncbi:MAG TPA: YsnF/AvaK domain-containing protein, partial [Pyrinomonadaceae bacterium]
VGKREVERGGVRVESRVEERPVTEEVHLREERVHVERRPVDRPVTNADEAFREGTLEVTERAEEAVVAKTAHVVEEVVVGKQVEEHTETVHDTLRRTDVDVQEVNTNKTTRTDRDR